MATWNVEGQKYKPMSRCSSVFEEFSVSVSELITPSIFVKYERLKAVKYVILHGKTGTNVSDI
jgi:hypothetical protein